MKAERIGHARRDEFHRAQHPARALFEFGDEAAFAELGKARPVLFGYRPYEGRAVPPPLVVDQRQQGKGARRVEDFVLDMAMRHFMRDRADHRVMMIGPVRSEEHTSELQSLMRISYAVFCLKKKNNTNMK